MKIGIASDVRSRFSGLGNASPDPLTLEFVSECDRDAAIIIEHRAHEILAQFRVHGEWFDVIAKEAVAAVFKAASDLGFELHEKEVPTVRQRGPKRGSTPGIGFRLPATLRIKLDRWADKQSDLPGRSEAIRRLLEKALDQA
jgi:hypothetical protein